MRPDVKIGVLLGAVLVVGSTAYYSLNDRDREDVPLTPATTTAAPAGDKKDPAPARPAATDKKTSAPARASKSGETSERTSARKRDVTDPRTRSSSTGFRTSDTKGSHQPTQRNKGQAKPTNRFADQHKGQKPQDKKRTARGKNSTANKSNANRSSTSDDKKRTRNNTPSAQRDDKRSSARQDKTASNPSSRRTPRHKTSTDRTEAKRRQPANTDRAPATREAQQGKPGHVTERPQPTDRNREKHARSNDRRGRRDSTDTPSRRDLAARDRAKQSDPSRPVRRPTSNQKPATKPNRTTDGETAVDIHKVQSGDTFSQLAQTYYGTVTLTDFLIKANTHIKNPDRLSIGMEIRIPERPEDKNTRPIATQPGEASKRTDTKVTSKSGQRTYTVKAGESFYAIAKTVLKDESRWEELFELNKDLVKGEPTALQIGQVIVLPAK